MFFFFFWKFTTWMLIGRRFSSYPERWVMHQNDSKLKILWCLWDFCIEQIIDDGQHIYKQFYILRMEILSSGCLSMQQFVWSRLWHFGVTFGSRLWHLWYKSCAHSCSDKKTKTKKLHNFCFGNTSQVQSSILIKKLIFSLYRQTCKVGGTIYMYPAIFNFALSKML